MSELGRSRRCRNEQLLSEWLSNLTKSTEHTLVGPIETNESCCSDICVRKSISNEIVRFIGPLIHFNSFVVFEFYFYYTSQHQFLLFFVTITIRRIPHKSGFGIVDLCRIVKCPRFGKSLSNYGKIWNEHSWPKVAGFVFEWSAKSRDYHSKSMLKKWQKSWEISFWMVTLCNKPEAILL